MGMGHTRDMKTRNAFGILKLEAEFLDVMVDIVDVGQLEANPSLVPSLEDGAAFLRLRLRGSSLPVVVISGASCESNASN